MNELVQSTSELFEELCLWKSIWEVSEDETVLGLVCESQQLQRNLVLKKSVLVPSINVLLDAQEEWVVVLFGLASELRNVSVNVLHRDNRDTQVNADPLDEFGLEAVWRTEEHDLGVLWPPLDELLTSLRDHAFQHFQ